MGYGAWRYRVETDGLLKLYTMDERQQDEFDDRIMREVGTGCAGAIVFWLVLVILMLCFASCKTRTIVVETVRTDTTYIAKHMRDSIYVHDSTYIHDKGDTVLIEKWHTKWRDRAVHDTTYIAKTDSVPVPYPVEVKVPRELFWWQKALQRIGGIALGLMLMWIIWKVWKLWKFFHP